MSCSRVDEKVFVMKGGTHPFPLVHSLQCNLCFVHKVLYYIRQDVFSITFVYTLVLLQGGFWPTNIYIHTYIHTHIYIYTYIYIYIYIYIYSCIQVMLL